MTAREALAFIRKHGLVMQSAHVAGVPVLVDFIAGSSIRGSWWGHPKGQLIFEVLNEVHDSGDVVALRLIEGKLTLAHRRVWPALAALAEELGRSRLAAVSESHTPSGKHVTTSIPFPDWVPADVLAAAGKVDLDEARSICAPASSAGARGSSTRRARGPLRGRVDRRGRPPSKGRKPGSPSTPSR